MTYEKKYLKYKNKYIKLKQQYGGILDNAIDEYLLSLIYKDEKVYDKILGIKFINEINDMNYDSMVQTYLLTKSNFKLKIYEKVIENYYLFDIFKFETEINNKIEELNTNYSEDIKNKKISNYNQLITLINNNYKAYNDKITNDPSILNNFLNDQYIKFNNCKSICEYISENDILEIFNSKYFNNNEIIKIINYEMDKIRINNNHTICMNDLKNEWVQCKDRCYNTINNFIIQELNSTIFILRSLSNSILILNNTDNTNDKLSIFIKSEDYDKLTNIWEEDKKYIEIKKIGPESIENINKKPGRLVLGFGPSSSGKTFWAKTILKILKDVDSNLPNSFISIDGGIYRESSHIYDIIKKSITQCYGGLENLVSANILDKLKGLYTLFDSDIVKKIMKKYLSELSDKINISLYVPETLGTCTSLLLTCQLKYKTYIEITKDKEWIGLLIWQHKNGTDCDFDEQHKCVGCTESGTKREKDEGKKYSSGAWSNSYANGKIEFIKAPGGSYEIHNSGGKRYKIHNSGGKQDSEPLCKSTITYHTKPTDKNIGLISDKFTNSVYKDLYTYKQN